MLRWIPVALPALAMLGLAPRSASACECSELDEQAAIAGHSVVFDGWVIDAPTPWRCPLPPAPKPRKGCVRIAVVDRRTCRAHGDLLGLEAPDRSGVLMTSIEDDATTFCGIKAGTYVVAGERWMGDDDGSLTYGRAITVTPGGSYVVYGTERPGQALRVGVFRAIKGQVTREARVISEPSCGIGVIRAGASLRFFAEPGPDGALKISGCSGVRELTDKERAQPVAASEPAPAPSPPPPSAPAPAPKAREGCAAAASEHTSAPALLLLAWVTLGRWRRRRATAPAPTSPVSGRGR